MLREIFHIKCGSVVGYRDTEFPTNSSKAFVFPNGKNPSPFSVARLECPGCVIRLSGWWSIIGYLEYPLPARDNAQEPDTLLLLRK